MCGGEEVDEGAGNAAGNTAQRASDVFEESHCGSRTEFCFRWFRVGAIRICSLFRHLSLRIVAIQKVAGEFEVVEGEGCFLDVFGGDP